MQKLDVDALTVESFATADRNVAFAGDTLATEAGISEGFECNRTLYLTCDTCKCMTPRYNCV